MIYTDMRFVVCDKPSTLIILILFSEEWDVYENFNPLRVQEDFRSSSNLHSHTKHC